MIYAGVFELAPGDGAEVAGDEPNWNVVFCEQVQRVDHTGAEFS